MPTRFSGGVNNGPVGALANLDFLSPFTYHTYYNDFDTYAAADWTITETGTGTRALGAVDGGALVVTNAAADDDRNFLQLKAASFTLVAGKKAFFQARFKIFEILQSDFQIGLVITDTTPLDATDGIYFQKDDGDALLDVYCRKNATTGSTTAVAATLAADTFVVVGWEYDGRGNLKYFVNNVHIGTLDASSTYFPDSIVNLSFGIQNGEAVANVLTLDYIFAAVER